MKKMFSPRDTWWKRCHILRCINWDNCSAATLTLIKVRVNEFTEIYRLVSFYLSGLRCITDNALNWHLRLVKICYRFYPFPKEGQEFVLWKLTVELNCIFFFRCDLDKQMLSRQSSILCQTAVCWGFFWGTGLQNEATSHVLSLSLEVWSVTSICWIDACPWYAAWVSMLNQNNECVHHSNGATLWMDAVRCFSLEELIVMIIVSSSAEGFLLGSWPNDWCNLTKICSALKWNGLSKRGGADNLKLFGQTSSCHWGCLGNSIQVGRLFAISTVVVLSLLLWAFWEKSNKGRLRSYFSFEKRQAWLL